MGAGILKQWSFPEELVNAVCWHHNPENCDNSCMLSDIVHVANNLGQVIGTGSGPQAWRSELSLPVIEKLGFKSVDLEEIAEHTRQRVNTLAGVL